MRAGCWASSSELTTYQPTPDTVPLRGAVRRRSPNPGACEMPPEPPAIGISMDIDKHVDRRRVLFLCTGNAARSQMAEGLLRRYGSDSFDVQSAGTAPADIILRLAVGP